MILIQAAAENKGQKEGTEFTTYSLMVMVDGYPCVWPAAEVPSTDAC